MSHKNPPATDVYHRIGHGPNEQHVGKPKVSDDKIVEREAGLNGEEGSRICGQAGPELLGGSASTRILGQSVGEQLKTQLPPNSGQ